MEESLIEFQKAACFAFLVKLTAMKTKIDTVDDFKIKLEDLHTSFLVLKNSFSIKSDSSFTLTKIGSKDSLEVYRAGDILCYTKDLIILGLDPHHDFLENLFINKNISTAKDTIEMYANSKNRNCDLCGKYFLKPLYATPDGRERMKDYIHVFHIQCKQASKLI